jgi:Kef-type K+ transport system membrane component KefB
MGIALSITAFPVLARILEERAMVAGAIGMTAMTAAALADLFAWLLITVATALALAGSAGEVWSVLAWTLAFAALMWWVVRPALHHAAAAYARATVSGAGAGAGWIALVLAGILLSAFATERIGLALIIGALVMGAVMPKRARLTTDVRSGSETFVTLLLLPLFFAYTGLRTDVGLLGEAELWLIAAALLILAIVGKLVTTALAARLSGWDWRGSALLGTLMNTRGLTELIVLNLGLEAGVISPALFTALVLMTLVTTFMAGPLLDLIDREGRFADRGRRDADRGKTPMTRRSGTGNLESSGRRKP